MAALGAKEIEQALKTCADEPTHTPGSIQPIGGLIAYEAETGRIDYVSADIERYLGRPAADLFAAPAREVLTPPIWHDLLNAAGLPSFATRREPIGALTPRETGGALDLPELDLHAFRSGAHVVVELEPAAAAAVPAATVIREVAALQEKILGYDSETELFEAALRLLKAASGYDRVVAYRFDEGFNGEVIAEARKARMESFLGLRFPHWDIPPQARALMAKVPIRFIADVDQAPTPILTQRNDLPPLDLTYAQLRGVAPVHMQYLRNMKARATLTLSVVVGGRLWGAIAFHHERPRTPSPHLRRISELLLPVLETALSLSQREDEIRLLKRASEVREAFERSLREAPDMGSLESVIASLAPSLIDAFQADGLAIAESELVKQHGITPSARIIARIIEAAREQPEDILAIQNIGERFSLEASEIDGFGGVLSVKAPDGSAIALFRRSRERSVAWAGAPEKQVEMVGGMARLSPRGSFARYHETVRGVCAPWLPRDLELARQLWNKLVNAEQKIAIAALARKQALLVDELNHRVRNIVALIRSVSRQARQHNSSLDSYQRALEARISALAAAHDLGSGDANNAVSLRQLIAVEARPFASQDHGAPCARITVSGPDCNVAAAHAPLVALVIHELMTNAAKYGALSAAEGRLEVTLSKAQDGGVAIAWRERDGPAVAIPNARGFGATLIEKAVPFELGGRTDLHFDAAGVAADIWLPDSVLAPPGALETPARPKPLGLAAELPIVATRRAREAVILIVEDNFVVATDLEDVLRNLGFRHIEVASSPVDAFEIIDSVKIDAAVLDVNLGEAYGDSFPIARRLAEDGVPFVFATGYGSRLEPPPGDVERPVLSKPVSTAELRAALLSLLGIAES